MAGGALPLSGLSFELWRQDDHGQRYLVGRYPDRAAAEMRLRELTRTLHKQIYWIEESGSPNHERHGNE